MSTFRKVFGILATSATLLAAAAAAAAEEDYEAQRLAFAATPGYDPYGLTSGEISTSLRARALWNQGERDQAMSLLSSWIQKYPLSIVGHRMLSEFSKTLATTADNAADQERLQLAPKSHFDKYAGLIRSIAHNTQCASYEDRCKVINIAEENAILVDAGGKTKVRQSVTKPEGIPFDVIVSRNSKGEERTFYFEISIFYKGL